ncbi:MAG: hypothetical protein A2096_04400 [Spirochaetes bacterium GWF1_41_5]|nr:MAG: hypothetical protein A2096_04400 [Spirochaetes bacterium GWF1_41_5]HBE01209.1 hypothetical protein [Spirochaetia bacterium]
MNIPKKRKILTRGGDGLIRMAEQDIPELKKGTIIVKVKATLVSPGTELKGWQGYSEKQKNPVSTEKHSQFGYSNTGIVIEKSPDVSEFKIGDRVACVGAGFALHTDYAVMPHNLCVPLPVDVLFEQGAYAMLLATAMQTLRRGEPEFGEYVCIVGLGIVGLLTARLYQLAGCFPTGWEINPFRRELAEKWGIPCTAGDTSAAKAFTENFGFDAAVLANFGTCDETLDKLVSCMKVSPDGHAMGKIMVVGWPVFSYGGKIGDMNNIDLRRCSRTGFGYHDAKWEFGEDYPQVAMRWTTKTNLNLCLRLAAEKKINVDALTTHRIPFSRAEKETADAMKTPQNMLGVIFNPEA